MNYIQNFENVSTESKIKDVPIVESPNNDDIIAKSNLYQKKRTVKLAQQVLNARLKIFNDTQSIEDLFHVYGEALKGSVSEGCITSIQNSKNCVDNSDLQKKKVFELIPNKADSFLVLPIGAYGHMLAGVIRKIDSETFKITVVNKGARSGNPIYKEYVLNEEKIYKFIDNLSASEKSISATYQTLRKSSISSNGLPFISSNQKIGNCFIKEPETAIKFAVFTSMQEKSLDMKEFITPKWPMPTIKMHTLFINELKKLRPEAAPLLNTELKIYQKNKLFRELIKTGSEPLFALVLAFNDGKLIKPNSSDELKILLRKINADTLRRNPYAIAELVESTGDKEFINKFNNIANLSNLSNAYISMPGTVDCISGIVTFLTWQNSLRDRVIDTVKTCQQEFPHVVDSLKHDYHAGYIGQIGVLGIIFNSKKVLKRLDDAIKLYPDNPKPYLLRGALTVAKGEIEKGLKDMEYSLELNPNFKEATMAINEIKKELLETKSPTTNKRKANNQLDNEVNPQNKRVRGLELSI